MITSRRTFLSLLAAPAIVKAANIMPVRGIIMAVEPLPQIIGTALNNAAPGEHLRVLLTFGADPNVMRSIDYITTIPSKHHTAGDIICGRYRETGDGNYVFSIERL